VTAVPRRDDIAMLREELSTGEDERRVGLLERLAATSEPPPAALVGALVDCLATGGKRVQRRAAEALARVEDPAVVRAALAPLLTSGDSDGRWIAAYALSLACGPTRELLPLCLEALGHADADRRWAAAALVVALGRAEPIAAELRSVVLRGDERQRKMSLYCLRDLRVDDPETTAVVVTALDDADPGVRLAALAAFGVCLHSPATAEAVARVLERDPDCGVRRAAAAALGGFRGVAVAREALVRATHSADLDVQRAARGALERLGG
jgi:HEAT repeat protein